MLVDQLSLRGVALAGLSPDSADFFRRNDIPFGGGKLVDVTLAGAQYDLMKAAITQLITDGSTGLLVVAIGSSAQFNPELAVKPIIDAVSENQVQRLSPLFRCRMPQNQWRCCRRLVFLPLAG